jgi:hypothetical protein
LALLELASARHRASLLNDVAAPGTRVSNAASIGSPDATILYNIGSEIIGGGMMVRLGH